MEGTWKGSRQAGGYAGWAIGEAAPIGIESRVKLMGGMQGGRSWSIASSLEAFSG